MKIRQGFVSNSSSSSYTCDICKRTEAGYNLGMSDAGMYSCENDHTFCEEHSKVSSLESLPFDELKIMLENYAYFEEDKQMFREATSLEDITDYEDWLEDFSYNELPSALCPLCNFDEMADRDLAKAAIKLLGKTRAETVGTLKDRFCTYKKFKEWVDEN